MTAKVTQSAVHTEPHSSQAYERLRAQALSPAGTSPDHRGLAILQRQGVTGWLATLAPLPPPETVPAATPVAERGQQRAEMVGILVAMVLAQLSATQGGKAMHESRSKVTPSHLEGGAYLDVRQSTLRQVFENAESPERQYAESRTKRTLILEQDEHAGGG